MMDRRERRRRRRHRDQMIAYIGTGVLLAAIVFGNEQKRLQLEELTTKKVIQIMEEQVLKLRTEGKYAIIFLDVPLLFETGADEMTDFVWLVTAEPDIRIARVTARDGISAEAVRQRMSSQMDEGEKIKRADELIDNSKGKEEPAFLLWPQGRKFSRWICRQKTPSECR